MGTAIILCPTKATRVNERKSQKDLSPQSYMEQALLTQQQSAGIRGMTPPRLPRFESQPLLPLLSMWPQTSYSIFLCPSFLISEIELL